MKHRTEGHTETTISGDTRADWSEAFELVPSLQIAYVWHASVFTREVLNGLLRIGFLYPQQIIWNKGRTVLTRTHYWYQHEPCWYVRKKNAPWFGKAGENSTIWDSPSPKFRSEQGTDCSHSNALLVSARALLVCAEEECSLVRQGRRKLNDLGFAQPEIQIGTRDGLFSLERTTGISTSPAGMCGRRMLPGSARPAKTQRSGIRPARNSDRNKGRTVLTRTHYWYQHEPCWYVRKKNAPWFGKAGENSTIWDSPSPKFIMGGSDEEKFDHPTQKPVELMRRPILNH